MENIIYSDFDVNLLMNPVTKDVVKKTNINSIKQSLRLLFSTVFYDRLWDPDVGSRLRDLLFNLLDTYQLTLVKKEIETLVYKYEPRVKIDVLDVTTAPNNEFLVRIKMQYTIRMLGLTDTFVYEITRLR